MTANPTEAFESNIPVKDKVNGLESWTKKGRYDSNGNFLNYTTHTFAPAGWSETKYMDEMRWAYNQKDSPLRTNIGNYQGGTTLKDYTIVSPSGLKYRVALTQDGKVKSFFITK